MKIKNIIILSSTVAFLGLGSFAGIKMIKANQNKEDIPNISEEDERYRSKVLPVPSNGTPADYDAITNLYIANGIVEDSLYYTTDLTGTAKANVVGINYTQNTSNVKIVNDDEVFLEAFSLSKLMKVAEQRYVTPNSYLVRKGKNVSESGAKYDQSSIVSLGRENYLSKYGSLPYSMSQYILNDEAILSAKLVSSDANTYTYFYEFDPDFATMKYARSVMTMGGASSLPTFTKAHMSVVMDKTWHVVSIDTDEIYDLAILGNLTIKANASEIFTFYDEAQPIPEREEFEPYFNAEIVDDPIDEKSGMNYLTEAFTPILMGNPLHIVGDLALGDKNYSLFIDADLKNNKIDISLDDVLNVFYTENDTSIVMGNLAFAIPNEQLKEVLKTQFSLDLDSFDMDALLESDFISSFLSTMEEEIKSDQCKLSFKTDFGNIDIFLVIDDENKASLQSIKANLKIMDQSCSINLTFNDHAHPTIAIPSDIVSIDHFDELVSSFIDFIEKKNYLLDLEFNYPIQDHNLNVQAQGYIKLNMEDISQSTCHLLVNITYEDCTLPLEITWQNQSFYLSYKENIHIGLSYDELVEVVEKMINEITGTISQPMDVLSTLNILELFDSINAKDDSISLVVSLAQFSLDRPVEIQYLLDGKLCLELESYGSITLESCEEDPTDFAKKYESLYVLSYEDILQYANQLLELVESPYLQLELHGQILLQNKLLSLDGEMILNHHNGDFEILLHVNYDDSLTATIQLNKQGKQYVLSSGGIVVSLSEEELSSLLEQIKNDFSLSLPIFEDSISFSYRLIENLLDGVLIDDEKITITIDTSWLSFDSHSITMQVFKNNASQIFITSDFGINMNLSSCDEYVWNVVQEEALQYDEIAKRLHQIALYIQQPFFNGTYFLSYEDIVIEGELYADLLNKTFESNLMLTYQDLVLPLYVQYRENCLYLSYQNQFVLCLPIEEMNDFINELQESFHLTLPSLPINLPSTLDISQLLSLTKVQEALSLQMDLSSFGIDSIMKMILDDDGLSIHVSPYVEIELSPCEEKSLVFPAGYQIDSHELREYLHIIQSYLDCPQYVIDIDIQQENLMVTGQMYVEIATMNVEIYLDVTYQNINVTISLLKVEDVYQIQIGNLFICLTHDELCNFLTQLQEKYHFLDPELFTMLSNLMNSSFDFSSSNVDLSIIKVMLDALTFNDGGFVLSLDGQDLQMQEMGSISLTFLKSQADVIHLSLNSMRISLQQCSQHLFILATGNELSMREVQYALDKVDRLIELFQSKTFSLTVSGRVYNKSTIQYQIDGSLYLSFNEEGTFSIRDMLADLFLKDQTMIHRIQLTYVGDRIYVVYENYELNANVLTDEPIGSTRISFAKNQLFTALNYMNQMFLKNGMLDQLVGEYGSRLTTDVLDGAIQITDDNGIICLNSYLGGLSITSTSMSVLINHDALNDYNPNGLAEIMIRNSINSNNEVMAIQSIEVSNFYTSFNTQIQLSANISTNEQIVNVPEGNYFDMDRLPQLLECLNYTIELKNYDVTGQINIGLGALNLASVPLTLKAKINENNPIVYLKLEVPYITYVIDKVTNAKTDSYLYFNQAESDIIYMKRDLYKRNWKLQWVYDSTDYLAIPKEEFLANFLEVFCYLFNFSDYIKDQIINSSTSDSTIYYAKLLKGYQYQDNQFALSIDGAELTANVLGDLNATIAMIEIEAKPYLQAIDASTTVYSILSMSLHATLNQILEEVDMSSYQLQDFIQA